MEQAGRRSVILYGLGNTVFDMIDYIRLRFRVIGCSDSNVEKKDVAEKLGLAFVPSGKLLAEKFDYILITSVYDDEISGQLIRMGLAQEKILKRMQWCKMLFLHSFGECNYDKTFYLLSHPIHIRDGLFSYLFAFLEQMDFIEKNGMIPVVDMQNFPCQYLGDDEIGKDNVWERYFLPLSEYSFTEVYHSQNVVLGYDDNCYKGNYEKKYDIKRMSDLYQKYTRYNEKTALAVQTEYEKKIDSTKKTLGVLYRGSDMNALKLKNHPVQPTVDEMILQVHKYMKEWKCERIFLSTEDADAAERMRAEFGELLSCTDQKRFSHTGKTWLANINFERPNDRYLKGLEYLITIELLSRCDSLLAGICTGSICAQIMNNGKYRHINMIDKGEY